MGTICPEHEKTTSDIGEIKDLLKGTLDKPGVISKLTYLENIYGKVELKMSTIAELQRHMKEDCALIKADVNYIKKGKEEDQLEIKTHIKESVPIRENVHDNDNFRKSATKALWGIYLAMIGVFVKLIFFKG